MSDPTKVSNRSNDFDADDAAAAQLEVAGAAGWDDPEMSVYDEYDAHKSASPHGVSGEFPSRRRSSMSSIPRIRLTPQEYLARERIAETKSEYYQGEVFAMAGARRGHNLIVGNTVAELRDALLHRPCEVYPSDMRVKVSATGLYTYPDVSVVCGEPRFEDSVEDTLLNPLMIVEVLSKSSEAYDRGKKFHQYDWIDSLQDYVLIAQDEYRIDRFTRQPNGLWSLAHACGIESEIELPSLQVTLRLAGVYSKVNVEATETE
jgi:Uma2 family endonuclease